MMHHNTFFHKPIKSFFLLIFHTRKLLLKQEGPVMATLSSMQKHKQFFSKNTDTSLSALFAFSTVADKAKSALSARKHTF